MEIKSIKLAWSICIQSLTPTFYPRERGIIKDVIPHTHTHTHTHIYARTHTHWERNLKREINYKNIFVWLSVYYQHRWLPKLPNPWNLFQIFTIVIKSFSLSCNNLLLQFIKIPFTVIWNQSITAPFKIDWN